MRKVFDEWFTSLELLVTDDLISYYAYFTIVFAEIAFLWSGYPKLALPFTCLLLASILNIVISSLFKCAYEYTKYEEKCAKSYVLGAIIIFIVGLCVNWLAAIVLFGVPLVITALWIKIREFQNTLFAYKLPKIIEWIYRAFGNPVFWMMSQIIVLGVPFGLLAAGVFSTGIPIWLKVTIYIVYIVGAPFIAMFEDSFATCNIFELAYDITWNGSED